MPRPDSERVVDIALELMPRGRGVRIADLGAGTGCLICAILHQRGGVEGVAVERDPGAAGLARENTKALGLDARIDIFVGDWANWKDWETVDLIVSNPPYIASQDIDTLAPTVSQYDPRQALDGGSDGLSAYRSILMLAERKMKAESWLVLEIGHTQKLDVESLMDAHGFTNIKTARDLGSRDRVVYGQRP